jgi:hypothetical protein
VKRLYDYFFDDFVPWLDTKPFYVLLLTVALPVLVVGWTVAALGIFDDDNTPHETKPRVEHHVRVKAPPTCPDLDAMAREIIEASGTSVPPPTTLIPTTTTVCAQK